MAICICTRWGDPVWDLTSCPLDLEAVNSCDGCSFLKILLEPSPLDNETSGS